MYSQRDEETHILKLIGNRTGRFLDIGAADGKTFSNTYRLAELGWEGLLIEPAARQFAALQVTHGTNKRMILVRAPVAVESLPMQWWESPDLVSTSDPEHHEDWKDRGQYSAPFIVWPMPVSYIFNHWGGFHFISIDTEGTSADLLMAMPIAEMLPMGVVVEHNGQNLVEISNWMGEQGYFPRYQSGENVLFGMGA